MTTHHFYKFEMPLSADSVLVLVLFGLTVIAIAGVFLYDEFKAGRPSSKKRRTKAPMLSDMTPLL